MVIGIKPHLPTFEVQFKKKLSNADVELKKNVACKKACIWKLVEHLRWSFFAFYFFTFSKEAPL